jgi:hypothetical protein
MSAACSAIASDPPQIPAGHDCDDTGRRWSARAAFGIISQARIAATHPNNFNQSLTSQDRSSSGDETEMRDGRYCLD